MIKSTAYWKPTRAVLLGLIIIFVISILTQLVNFLYSFYLTKNLSPQDLGNIIHHPDSIILFVRQSTHILFWLTYLGVGFMVGYKIKEKGWFYGSLVGLIWTFLKIILILSITILYFILPNNLYRTKSQSYTNQLQEIQIQRTLQGLHKSLINITIPLTMVGGWLGQEWRKKKKQTSFYG